VSRGRGNQDDRTIFTGWIVVAAAFSVLAVAYGVQFSFGLFIDPITEETGWSTAMLSLAFALYVGLYSLLSSVSGWATDRFGPRVVIFVGGLLLGAGWALVGLARRPWQLFVALSLIAAAGMSASWVPCSATVVKWFVRRRGLAVGVASTGGSVGNLIAPPLVAAAIGLFGWRPTLVVTGVLAGVLVAGLARYMIRSPEAVGLYPDGDVPVPDVHASAAVTESVVASAGVESVVASAGVESVVASAGVESAGPAFTVSEARRTATFWVMFAIFGLTWLVVFVPFVHLVPYAEDNGIGSVAAAGVISVIGLGGAAGRLIVGPGSDRLGRRVSLGAMLGAQAAAFVAFAYGAALWALVPAAFVFGFAYGGGVTTMPGLAGDFFGRTSSGAIVGLIFALSGSLAAVGPFVAGAMFDATGSYRTAFLLSALCNVGALALVGVLRPPHREAGRVAAGWRVATGGGDGAAGAA